MMDSKKVSVLFAGAERRARKKKKGDALLAAVRAEVMPQLHELDQRTKDLIWKSYERRVRGASNEEARS